MRHYSKFPPLLVLFLSQIPESEKLSKILTGNWVITLPTSLFMILGEVGLHLHLTPRFQSRPLKDMAPGPPTACGNIFSLTILLEIILLMPLPLSLIMLRYCAFPTHVWGLRDSYMLNYVKIPHYIIGS